MFFYLFFIAHFNCSAIFRAHVYALGKIKTIESIRRKAQKISFFHASVELVQFEQLRPRRFPLAQHKNIDKRRYGLRIDRAGTARDDNGKLVSPVLCKQRKAGKVQHKKHIGIR